MAGLFDFQDPNSTGLMGFLSGMAPGMMPSRVPIPLGAILAGGAGGALGGYQQGQENQQRSANLVGTNLNNLTSLQYYNSIAPYFGMQPMTMDELRSGKFPPSGAPLGVPPPPTSGDPQTQGAPVALPLGGVNPSAPPPIAAPQAAANAAASPPVTSPAAIPAAAAAATGVPVGDQAVNDASAEYASLSGGRSPQSLFMLGQAMLMRDPAAGEKMMEMAANMDPRLQGALAKVKSENTLIEGRAGSQPMIGGEPVGKGVPMVRDMPDGQGGEFPALVYPSGDVVDLRSGKNVTQPGNSIPPGASAGSGNGVGGTLTPYMEERQKGWGTQMNDWGTSIKQNYIAEQRTEAIMSALKATQSGAWATEKADIAAKLKAVGITLPTDVMGDPSQVQVALKDNFQASLEQIRAFTSRPAAAEVMLAQKNFANPNLQPEANLAIGSQVIGTLRWDRDAYAAAQKQLDKSPGDPDAFVYNWGQTHPIQGYIDRASAELGPLKGMAQQPGPQSSAASSGGPVRIANASDYAALAKGTRYVDPQGNIRIKQ